MELPTTTEVKPKRPRVKKDKPVASSEVKTELEKPTKPKVKREPSAYNKFFKENFNKCEGANAKEKMKHCSVLWKESKM